MRNLVFILCIFAAGPVLSESVVAARTVRAQTILTEQDLAVQPVHVVGAYNDPALLVGLETRAALYAGRPVRPGDVGPPAIIDRNQIIVVMYATSSLTITTEGRAMGRGGVGDKVRVLNMSSRVTVEGVIRPDGSVLVQ
jgi:flagellar basal body P-ring formation protein FlgA